MSTLTVLFVACTLAAITLGLYAGYLVRGRPPADPPVAAPPPEPGPRLPGMPPRHGPAVPSTWSAVDRRLEAPRVARGSVAPHRVGANRFDDVLTAGLPVVPPPTADYD